MSIISVTDLSCEKRDRLLFDNVNFGVECGELLYIQGPNGAGKTSLLRILTGLSDAAQGQVSFKGLPLHQCRADYHNEMLYFGHKLGLNHHLSATENLLFWSAQHKVNTNIDEVLHILTLLGLVGLEELPLGNLSAGQQRRVALARLWLHKNASLWILDEPFTALDIEGIALLKQRMSEHLEQQGAIVMTSHQTLEKGQASKELLLEYRI